MCEFDESIRKRSRQFFEAELRQYGEVMPTSGQDDAKLVELVRAGIPSDEDFQFLDIGCGLGYVARTVKSLAPHATVFGVDISRQVIAKARQADLSSSVRYEVADELALPYGSGTIDVAACRYSIHHFPDVAQHLLEVRRVLKSGGVYLIIDAMPHPGEYDEWLNDLFVSVERSSSGHVKFYTHAEYERFAEAAGFEIDKVEPFGLTLELDTERPHFAAMRKMPVAFQRMVSFETRGERFSIDVQAAGIYCHSK